MAAVRPAAAAAVAGALVLAAAAGLLVGRYPAPGLMPWTTLVADPTAAAIVWGARLPRLLAALLAGAVLGGAGGAFQLAFANPLVEPGFLGVSQGAAFGAALAMLAGARTGPAVALPAFAFALAALAFSAALARRFRYGGSVLRLVLAGIAVSAVFSAGLSLVKYAADPMRVLPDIAYWTLGGLSGVTWRSLAYLAPPCLLSLAALLALRSRLDLLSLDEDVARSLGARPRLERPLVLAAAALGVAAVTAQAGIIAWAGLVVPHAARILFGAKARVSLPAAMLLGAAFVALCDTFARAAFAGELPLGASVSVFGAVAFVLFLTAGKTRIVR
jgi:iron complex transport system permease protein